MPASVAAISFNCFLGWFCNLLFLLAFDHFSPTQLRKAISSVSLACNFQQAARLESKNFKQDS
jgi:hypothetical protein